MRPYGSRLLINACKDHRYLNTFSVRTTLRKDVYDKVAERWSDLGLPGAAPHLPVFEEQAAKATDLQGGRPEGPARRAPDEAVRPRSWQPSEPS